MTLQRKAPMKRTAFPSQREPQPGKPKLRKCANRACRAPYAPDPKQPFKVWCSADCAVVIAKARVAKQKLATAKAERAADKAKREKLKTKSDYMREAQAAVNAYVRLRDEALPCISCGVSYPITKTDVWDAGHLRSAGSSPGTRLNTLNIHKQCVKCNRHLSSNAVKYRIKLIEKIGIELVERIEHHNGVAKFSHDYLMRFKAIFRKRVRHLMKLRARTGNGKERIEG
jgi:hypothetical protein